MIITTTNSIENYEITDYLEIVFGEVITGINILKDIGASIKDIFGGRSVGYEEELLKARAEALQEIKERAKNLNADAIVGIKMDYEVLGQGGTMLMVTCSGTAVKIRKK